MHRLAECRVLLMQELVDYALSLSVRSVGSAGAWSFNGPEELEEWCWL